MAHSLTRFDPNTLLLEYSGLVGYAERSEAVSVAAEYAAEHGVNHVLIDFSRAVVFEEGAAQRADFLAKAILAWNFEGVCVAFVGISRHYALPGELACQMRHNPVRLFDRREQALAWLAQGDEEQGPRQSDSLEVAPL